MRDCDWLEVRDKELHGTDIARHAEEYLAMHASAQKEDPVQISLALWDQYIGHAAAEMLLAPMLPEAPDIYPADYKIDHRHPLLGPINSIVRRVINLEVRRYLDPAIRKQSRLNRQFREALTELLQENHRLQRELEALKTRGSVDGEVDAP